MCKTSGARVPATFLEALVAIESRPIPASRKVVAATTRARILRHADTCRIRWYSQSVVVHPRKKSGFSQKPEVSTTAGPSVTAWCDTMLLTKTVPAEMDPRFLPVVHVPNFRRGVHAVMNEETCADGNRFGRTRTGATN